MFSWPLRKSDLTDYNILIACECSGIVRDAFISLGYRAVSCDLKPTQRPGPHYLGRVEDILYLPHWRLLIAHPVCRYLANSSSKHLYRRVNGVWSKANGKDPERWRLMRAGVAFFLLFENATHIPMRAVENPIMHKYARALIGRPPTQYIQPHWFGDPFSKATGLHLTNLPKLLRTYDKKPSVLFGGGYDRIIQKSFLLGPSEEREELRSQTEPGVARAFAQQWGPLVGR